MARVTATEVLAIMDGVTLTDPQVEPYITAAELFINKIFAGNTEVGEDLLTEVEKWFTAHMIAVTKFRTASKEKVGDADVTYTGKWGEGLSSTSYGQMVLLLDTSGLITKAGKFPVMLFAIPSFDHDDTF
jgi:hypothetical protein